MKYSAKAISKAVALVRDKGYSYAAAGEKIGGAHRFTVKRWCDDAGVRSGEADARTDVPRTPKAPEQCAPEPAPAPVEDESLEGILRDMQAQLRWTKEQAREAAKDGNQAAAGKHNVSAVKLANTIARLKAGAAKESGAGGIVISAERLKAIRAEVIERVDRLAASPEGSMGVCPRCGADIRMARASAPDAGKES